MARKTAVRSVDPRVTEAVEEAEVEAEVRGELADAAYELQDERTRALLDKMVAELRQNVTGNVIVGIAGQGAPISREALDANLRYVATEILKNLAVFDIRVGTYVIPSNLCVLCGVEL